MKQIMSLLTRYFGDSIEFQEGLRGETFLILKDPAKIVDVLTFLKENGFNMLIDLTAVHYPHKEYRFEVIYNMLSMEPYMRLIVKVPLKDDWPEIDSVTSLYKTANWYEREVYDMFGIRFKNHPNLKRILMWEGFDGHPLRKEYPLEGDNLHCHD